jgi:uncharacterized protein YdeI (YjbR/CyaY-like superfamily)
MKNLSPKVDAYIAKSPEYARPILKKIRSLFHKACPQIEETIKWGFPHFEYKGIVGSMAAFQRYTTFGFWKGKLLSDPHKMYTPMAKASMSHASFEKVSDLPADSILLQYIREAVALNEQGVKAPPRARRRRPELQIPDLFALALKKNKRALGTFEAFSPTQQREYVEWITEARREETRTKRLATAIEWMSQGKPRNWKYMKK